MKSYRRKDYWHQVIKDEVDASEGKLPIVNEMSLPLDKYIGRIESFRFELAENWCLCKWCQLFDPANINFGHWKKELCTYIKRLKMITLKNNANKYKHLHDVLVDECDYNDEGMIVDIIADKFKKEGIVDEAQMHAAAYAFADNIEKLIEVIADRSLSLESYITSAFGIYNQS